MKRRLLLVAIFGLSLLAFSSVFLQAGEIKDSESASHDSAAAFYSVVDTYEFPGFKVIQFDLPVLSHFSYMLISKGEALVVDPGRDIDAYLDAAKKEKVKINGVFLTHSHADFVAGHMELAQAVKCPIYQNKSSGAEYSFVPLVEGSEIEIGEAVVRFMETPGHTPDGLCALVFSARDKDKPELLFTGDTLFVGSVGRPDLLEGAMTAASLASMLFDSWNNKLAPLPDAVMILPAHGAGSLCGAHLSDQPKSSIGEQRAGNAYLQHHSRGEFIAAVLQGLPEAPQYFKHNAAMNRKGPKLVDWQAPLNEIAAGKALTDPMEYYVVDLRDQKQYSLGHIPNSVNIGLRGRLENWVGTMVPWESKVVLAGAEDELKEAVHRLHRVGYEAQTITMQAWQKAGLPLATSTLIRPAALYALMQQEAAPIVVDVRLPEEWMGVKIGTVVNLPLNHLAALAAAKLDPTMATVTVCNSAYRSSMAVGILQRLGFSQVSSLEGGTEEWVEQGLPVVKGDAGSAPRVSPKNILAQQVRLPERISADELMRLMMDLPGSFELVDIRPREYFDDYNLPGAVNVDVVELLQDASYLAGVGLLVVVDRDGSLAMAVAGILSQKTERPIKALYGGMEAYWTQAELNRAVSAVPMPSSASPPASRAGDGPPAMQSRPTPEVGKPTAPPAPAAPATPASEPPKKKSAGC